MNVIMIRIFLAISLILLPSYLWSQILPAEGSKLNYRLVGFSFPEDNGSVYTLEIAGGKHVIADSFRKHIIMSLKSAKGRVMSEVPSFGADYTWRVKYSGNRKKDSTLFHFSTLMNDRVDTTKYRLRILQPTTDYQDMFATIDGGGVIYDFKGNAIAYLPEVNGLAGFVADWKFTDEGTMTFNFGKDAYETNLNGDILWRIPETNSVNTGILPEKYHHAFFKLSNGHYMTLGMEFKPSKRVSTNDTSYIVLSDEKNVPYGYKLGAYGTIIEFDKDGKVVWSWKDTKNLVGTDFDYFNTTVDTNWQYDPHSNSLFYDEAKDFVYLSYRNLSRIIKIDHKSGKIVEQYGENFKPGSSSKGYGFFCNPHGVRISTDGSMYFFNNNSCWNTDSLPTIVVLKEPVNKSDSLKKVWEYTCTVEGDYSKRFGAGGSVVQMEDRSMFVCMGNAFSKIFIVTPQKKVTWSALPERHVETDNIWVNVKQYKANIITRKDLEHLVWNAETAAAAKK